MTSDGDGVRRARPAEAPDLAALWLRSRRAAPGVPPAAHTDDEVREWFRDVVLPSREVWVATRGHDPAALMVLDGCWVDQLYVAPEHLRRGHGSRLLEIAQASRDSLALWTFEANRSARSFYERHGFRRSGDASADNEEATTALCYRWTRR